MSTQKQIDANRRNAQKSTGPRTAEGKAASRLNALRHGVFANSPVIIGEAPEDFDDLAHSYFDRFQPATPEEHTLVTSLIRNAWLLERFTRIETELWDRRFEHIAETRRNEQFPLAHAADFLSPTLLSLQRRIDSTDRAYRRNLELLLKLQAQRQQPADTENGSVQSKPATSRPKPQRPPRPQPDAPMPTSPYPLPAPPIVTPPIDPVIFPG